MMPLKKKRKKKKKKENTVHTKPTCQMPPGRPIADGHPAEVLPATGSRESKLLDAKSRSEPERTCADVRPSRVELPLVSELGG